MAPRGQAKGRSLTDYVKAKRRAACAVCSLPDGIREEIRAARSRKINRDTIMDWLKEEHDITLTHDQFNSHQSGHHDRQEG